MRKITIISVTIMLLLLISISVTSEILLHQVHQLGPELTYHQSSSQISPAMSGRLDPQPSDSPRSDSTPIDRDLSGSASKEQKEGDKTQ